LRVAEKFTGQQLPCPACKAMLQVSADGRDLELAPSKGGTAKHGATPWLGKEAAVDLGSGVKLELVLIPAGSFMMGDEYGNKGEMPVHKVTITKPFYMGKYPVTQEQLQAVMGGNLYSDRWHRVQGPQYPAGPFELRSCQEFLQKLNSTLAPGGGRFSLPTEAQWEYACRAGSTALYCFGDLEAGLEEYAWYRGNSTGTTHPVGQKRPNSWGLYDMHGNVSECCADGFDEGYYSESPENDPTGPKHIGWVVIRGGCFFDGPDELRCAWRGKAIPELFPAAGSRGVDCTCIGFRVVRIPRPAPTI
jgi:formylglycine-generating enzyme required for sulfatase activity